MIKLDVEIRPETLKEKFIVVICAYNEEKSILYPIKCSMEEGFKVLVIDDGSDDLTGYVASQAGAFVLRHEVRMGKTLSLQHAIEFAKSEKYEFLIEIGADALPEKGAISKIAQILKHPAVGGVSVLQIPLGSGLVYHIEEFLWSMLAHGKRVQQILYGFAHLGAVLYGFKLNGVQLRKGIINDDENVGILLISKNLKTIFIDSCKVYFDASSSIKHCIERRKRMILGHLQVKKSTAPSMDLRIALMALIRTLMEKPKRIAWLIPAITIEIIARLSAWKTLRDITAYRRYMRWQTHQFKKKFDFAKHLKIQSYHHILNNEKSRV